jgi:transcription elongation factor GreA
LIADNEYDFCGRWETMTDEHYLTKEGFAELKAELERLVGQERSLLSKRLREAIQMGDLSENADYHKAKEDQAFLEGRIQELEYILSRATIIDTSSQPRDMVEVGATVTIQEEDYPPDVYQLVGPKEADPGNGRISNESPIGKVLLGKREGDVVMAITPGGSVRYKILKIE